MPAVFDPTEPPGGPARAAPAADAAGNRAARRLYDLAAASIRAHAGERDLHFRAGRLYRGERALPIFGPHLLPLPGVDDVPSFRGTADASALRLLHSDLALHRRLRPHDPIERWVFELLEQCRVESMLAPTMPGVARNLRHRFDAWSLQFHDAGGTDGARGLLLYTVAQIARSRITGVPVTAATEDLIEATRAGIAPAIGVALAGLRRERHDQAAFAEHAQAVAAFVARQFAEAGDASDADSEEDEATARPERRFGIQLDFDAEPDEGIAQVEAGDSRTLAAQDGRYRVFTRAFDRECTAGQLVRAALLQEQRSLLDARVAGLGFNFGRLARLYRSLLSLPQRDGWDDGQEEGLIDGRRLPQLITSPAERRLFRVESARPLADAIVTLLIDCSGSMRQHAPSVAVLVDVLTRVLDLAGARSEVLGFTTGAWNGGRALRAWQREGRPARPGRLNEQLHIVFKDAATPWRKARQALAALLKADLFREGVDGEAVQWACDRLLDQDADRRILLVLTDGCPMDTATGLANDDRYLDHHLRSVVARHEAAGQVQVIGLGVGLDLSPYYRHALALDLRLPPGTKTVQEIAAALGPSARR